MPTNHTKHLSQKLSTNFDEIFGRAEMCDWQVLINLNGEKHKKM